MGWGLGSALAPARPNSPAFYPALALVPAATAPGQVGQQVELGPQAPHTEPFSTELAGLGAEQQPAPRISAIRTGQELLVMDSSRRALTAGVVLHEYCSGLASSSLPTKVLGNCHFSNDPGWAPAQPGP